jgi:hypothetical protein
MRVIWVLRKEIAGFVFGEDAENSSFIGAVGELTKVSPLPQGV